MTLRDTRGPKTLHPSREWAKAARCVRTANVAGPCCRCGRPVDVIDGVAHVLGFELTCLQCCSTCRQVIR